MLEGISVVQMRNNRDLDWGVSSGDEEKRKNSRYMSDLVENEMFEVKEKNKICCHKILICFFMYLFVDCKLLKVRTSVQFSSVAQSCLTPSDPIDCSLPGSSVHGIFQARVLEWGAIAFSGFNP